MNFYFIIASMIFFHIIDDFVLQPICLNKLKTKSWWKENAPDKLYSHDYVAALFAHSFSWAFMMMLPIAIALKFNIPEGYIIWLIVNTVIHAAIDDVKANWRKTNLIEDQALHLIQIAITFIMLKDYLM